MKEPLGRGLGALLTDSSREAASNSDRSISIREKERQVEALQEKIDQMKKKIGEEKKRLSIELMLNRKPDNTELIKMEASQDSLEKRRDTLVREITSLRRGKGPLDRVDGPGAEKGVWAGLSIDETSVPDPDDIDIQLLNELMTPLDTLLPEAEQIDEEHIIGLKKELDRNNKVEEVRREAYKARCEMEMLSERGRSNRPKRVKVVRGTARTISKKRDEKIYDLVKEALERLSKGDVIGSRDALQKVLMDHPNDDEVLYHLGNTYFMEGNLDEAFKLFTRSVEMNPRSSRAFNNLGVVCEKQGDKGSALQAFNQALEIEPGFGRAWMNLGALFMDLEPPLLWEASIFLKRALELQPGLVKARRKLEECETRMEHGK